MLTVLFFLISFVAEFNFASNPMLYLLLFNLSIVITAFAFHDVTWQIKYLRKSYKKGFREFSDELLDKDTMVIFFSLMGFVLMALHFGFDIFTLRDLFIYNTITAIISGFYISMNVPFVLVNGISIMYVAIMNYTMIINTI